MKICCVSDLHGNLPRIPDCDGLFIAGDLVPTRMHEPRSARSWLDTNFRGWLRSLGERGIEVVGIAGNHDFVFELDYHHFVDPLPWTYLQEDLCVVHGSVKVYGLPHQPFFCNWAFNLSESQLAEKWTKIPPVDVLIVHGPPHGVGDLVPGNPSRHVGSTTLRTWVENEKPRLVVTGHIHAGYGVYDVGPTKVVNCAYVDEDYRPTNRPIVLELTDDGLEVLECGML